MILPNYIKTKHDSPLILMDTYWEIEETSFWKWEALGGTPWDKHGNTYEEMMALSKAEILCTLTREQVPLKWDGLTSE